MTRNEFVFSCQTGQTDRHKQENNHPRVTERMSNVLDRIHFRHLNNNVISNSKFSKGTQVNKHKEM